MVEQLADGNQFGGVSELSGHRDNNDICLNHLDISRCAPRAVIAAREGPTNEEKDHWLADLC